jgi:hypothetical protein
MFGGTRPASGRVRVTQHSPRAFPSGATSPSAPEARRDAARRIPRTVACATRRPAAGSGRVSRRLLAPCRAVAGAAAAMPARRRHGTEAHVMRVPAPAPHRGCARRPCRGARAQYPARAAGPPVEGPQRAARPGPYVCDVLRQHCTRAAAFAGLGRAAGARFRLGGSPPGEPPASRWLSSESSLVCDHDST